MEEGTTSELSPETQALAAKGREGREDIPADPLNPPKAPEAGKPERPADVPEKFWDADKGTVNTEALLKSYSELEKMKGGKPAEAVDEGTEGDDEDQTGLRIKTPPADEEKQPGEDEGGEKVDPQVVAAEAMTAAITTAQQVYAETGELNEEAVNNLVAAGIPAGTIALYVEGIKAQERALEAAAHEAAGGSDAFAAAVNWAAKNWSEDEIKAFNGAVGNPKLVKTTVGGLMAAYQAAEPGEGKLTNTRAGADLGDVYSTKEEFLKDLSAATASGDPVARQKAVAKLERSKKAGTVKEITPRNQLFG